MPLMTCDIDHLRARELARIGGWVEHTYNVCIAANNKPVDA